MRRRLLLGLLLGCSRPSEPGTCYRPTENVCIVYGRESAAAGKRLCSGMTWTEKATTCPAAGHLGTCTKKDAVEQMYEGAPNHFDAASARSACTSGGGVFSP